MNYIYHGNIYKSADYTEADIKNLGNKVVATVSTMSFDTGDAPELTYSIFALPTSLGWPSFSQHGGLFTGGYLLPTTVSIDSEYGLEVYYIFRSVNHSIPNSIISVS